MRYLFLTLILIILITSYIVVNACSCIGDSNIEDDYNYSDIVIQSNVLSINEIWGPYSYTIEKIEKENLSIDSIEKNYFNGYFLKRVKIEVITDFKRNLTTDTLIIYTSRGHSGDCGFRFEIGETYIIYGRKEVYKYGNERLSFDSDPYPRFWTDICHRTQKVNNIELKKIEELIGLDLYRIPIPIYRIKQ